MPLQQPARMLRRACADVVYGARGREEPRAPSGARQPQREVDVAEVQAHALVERLRVALADGLQGLAPQQQASGRWLLDVALFRRIVIAREVAPQLARIGRPALERRAEPQG